MKDLTYLTNPSMDLTYLRYHSTNLHVTEVHFTTKRFNLSEVPLRGFNSSVLDVLFCEGCAVLC